MIPRLVVLTDRSQLRLGRGLTSLLAEAYDAGLTHVVLRELDLAPSRRAALADALRGIGLTVIAAHGQLPGVLDVHLPAGAAPSGPPVRTWGRSCHSADEVFRAARDGASWATLSPYAASRSKPGHGPALDADAYAGLPLPTYALGGIEPHNARAAREAGAHGVAVMGAVMRSARPGDVVTSLRRAVEW